MELLLTMYKIIEKCWLERKWLIWDQNHVWSQIKTHKIFNWVFIGYQGSYMWPKYASFVGFCPYEWLMSLRNIYNLYPDTYSSCFISFNERNSWWYYSSHITRSLSPLYSHRLIHGGGMGTTHFVWCMIVPFLHEQYEHDPLNGQTIIPLQFMKQVHSSAHSKE